MVAPACGGSSTFCLIDCSLGCRSSGDCSVTEIAQNQFLQLNFSQTIDPGSVNGSTVSLRTAGGEAPAGQFIVQGSSLIFQPSAAVVGGSTVFGFRPNETYLLSLAGPSAADSIRSDSGDPLSLPVFCQLNVSRGFLDLDQRAPQAELLTSVDQDLGRREQIVLRFSELLDSSGFAGVTPGSSPVTYQIRSSVPDPLNPGGRICASAGATGLVDAVPVLSVDTSGAVPRTVVTLTPGSALPGNSCVRVTVTGRVRDLSGRSANLQSFDLIVEAGVSEPFTVTESFGTTANLEIDSSSVTIGGGEARVGDIGGPGLMGEFDLIYATQVAANVFEVNTDTTVIPANRTLFGTEIPVVGGVFDFSKLVIPADTIVRFVGDTPPVLLVSGDVDVQGTLSVDGGSVTPFIARTPGPSTSGQSGGLGGPGGGDGGRGGNSGNGLNLPAFFGQPGLPGTAPMTSGYSGLLGLTGGDGGQLFPVLPLATDFQGLVPGSLAGSGGGGGGGLVVAGGTGTRSMLPTAMFQRMQDLGPDTSGGMGVGIQPIPMATSSLDHFLVGGGGGGGGGSGIFGATRTSVLPTAAPIRMNAGAGGAGGGGAIAIRAGGSVVLSTGAARISARGGSAAVRLPNPLASDSPLPGGGGSAGSVVIQAARGWGNNGAIDIRGGSGGSTEVSLAFTTGSNSTIVGGDGSHGLVRLELPVAPTLGELGTVSGPPMLPPESVGALDPNDRDSMTSLVSRFRSTGRVIPPTFSHYRLTTRINGTPRVFTDEFPMDSSQFATFANGPIELLFQGATVSPGSSTATAIGPFRNFVNAEAGLSINQDVPTGFRFLMMFDRTMGDEIIIEELVVFGEG